MNEELINKNVWLKEYIKKPTSWITIVCLIFLLFYFTAYVVNKTEYEHNYHKESFCLGYDYLNASTEETPNAIKKVCMAKTMVWVDDNYQIVRGREFERKD